jgi:hypothetical protein
VKRHALFSAAFAVLFAVSGPVAVASVDPQTLTIRDIVTQQTQLRTEVASARGPFKDLSDRQRADLMVKQDEVLGLLQGVDTLDALRPEQRVVVFNNLEWIKSVVAKAEDERMVCEYTKTVGSHMARSVCLSAREWERVRSRAQDTLNRSGKCGASAVACTGDEKPGGLGSAP